MKKNLPSRRRLAPVALAAALALQTQAAHALAISWTNAASSFWDLATNWSGNVLPRAADDVSLTLAGTRTVTFRSGTVAVNSLAITGSNTLAVTGGTLSVATLSNAGAITQTSGTVNVAGGDLGTYNLTGTLGLGGTVSTTSGNLRLAGGIVSGGTVQQSAANGLVFNSSSNNTLSNVTIRGVLNIGDAANPNGRTRVSTALNVRDLAGATPGVVNVGTIAGGTGAILGFTGTQTFDNATINLGSGTQNGTISLDGGGTFTLGSNGIIRGSGGDFGVAFVGGTGNVVNNGTFSADINGRTLTVNNSGTLNNAGLMEARNGATLTLSGNGGSNTGVIRVVDAASTVNLSGTMSTSTLGTFDNAAGGNLNLTGTLTNSASTLSFSAATGSMRMAGGSVVGGTIQLGPAQGLVFNSSNNNTLNGVTVRGALNIGDAVNVNGRVRISNGLVVQSATGTLPGVVNVGTIAGATGAILGFTGTQTFDNATINLGSGTQNGSISLDSGGTFTLGSNGIIRGSGGNFSVAFSGGTGSIVNHGTFSADISGCTLTVNNSGTLTNNGLLEARNGGVLTLSSNGGTNTGVIRVVDAGSTVNLAGTLSTSALGSFDNAAGGNLNLTGTLTNSSSTLSFSAATGSMRVNGGSVVGGTVQLAPSQGLVFSSNNSNTLNDVTVRGVLNIGDVANPSGRLRISTGLVVQDTAGNAPGVVNVGTVAGATGAILGFTGTQTFDNATINLGSATQNGSLSLDTNGTFTLGGSGVIRGSGGNFTVAFSGGTGSITNNGRISADLNGRTLTVNNNGALNNNGVLEARNGGVLTLSANSGTNTGVIRVVDAASTVNLAGTMSTSALGSFDNAAGGNLNLTGSLINSSSTLSFSSATGSMRVNGGSIVGGTVQLAPSQGLVFAGNNANLLNGVAVRGVLNIGDSANPTGRVRVSNGLVVQDVAGTGPGVVNVGTASGATGAILGFTGTQTFDNATINLGSATQNGTLSLDTNGTFTLGSNALVQGSGGSFAVSFVGGAANLVNNGRIAANIAGRTLTINNNGAFTNNGALEASGGATLTLTPNAFTNFSGSTLTGGSYHVVGASALRFAGANIVSNAATIVLDGAGSSIFNGATATNGLANFANNSGSFTVRNGRNFTTVGAFDNSGIVNVGSGSTFSSTGAANVVPTGQIQLAGGTWAGAAVVNSGLITGQGSVAPSVSNTGHIVATGGTLSFAAAISGPTGLITIDPGATLGLGASSSVATFSDAGALALGSSNLTVSTDYSNANFGEGNSFNRRAGVTGTGQIMAAGSTQQTLSGALVSGGSTATPTMALPNIRVGQGGITTTFAANNTGAGGPSLRGALLTTAISNPGLTGSGVTAQNWGALAQGSATPDFSVTFNPALGQALSSQSVAVVNNFDNVAGQVLSITGSAFNLAVASAAAPSPVVFTNQRVGGTLSQALTISNTAPASGFSEALNASISANGSATAAGSFSLLAAGASSNALVVGLDTSSAGPKSGVATITLASDGTGTSGFGPLALAAQTVNVSGNVYRLASFGVGVTGPITLPDQRVGGSATQTLGYSNVAVADGYSESLNGSISASGTATAGGSFAQLAAGSSSNALFVGVDTSVAGNRGGTATVTLVSNGNGSSGLGTLALGTQAIDVSGRVFNAAQASAVTPTPVILPAQRVGGTLTQALTVSNTAPAGLFSERLNASLVVASGSATASGAVNLLLAGATSSNDLFVGVNTNSAGPKDGTVWVGLVSSGTGVNNIASDLTLPSQLISVSGAVYRLAVPQVSTTPIVLSARVGGAAPSRTVAVGHAASDAYNEPLNASWSAPAPAGFTLAGAVNQLAGGASSTAMTVTLQTTTAGTFQGSDAVINLSSSGSLTAQPDAPLGTASVPVTGRVWAPAVAGVSPQTVDFGIVRVGDAVAARTLTVANSNSGALTDTLNATLGRASHAVFDSSGSVAGLASGSNNGSGLQVQLNTATAGSFTATAGITLSSSNPDLPDLALPGATLTLQAQVNNLAQSSLVKTGGAGLFSGGGTAYTLDFGSLEQGSGGASATLSLANVAFGPADALSGSWELSALQPDDAFTLAGFGSFNGLAAGGAGAALSISFSDSALGVFDRVLVLRGISSNGSGPDLPLADVTLHLQGSVVAVPEPGSYALMLGGGLLLMAWMRRRQRPRD